MYNVVHIAKTVAMCIVYTIQIVVYLYRTISMAKTYYVTQQITAVNSFIVQASDVNNVIVPLNPA